MQAPSTLYYNGTIYTMDRDLPRVDAILVREDRIVALGPNDLVELETDARTVRVDLGGQTVVPGFNDCHCHILPFGLTLEQIDLSADAVRTIGEIRQKVAERASDTASESWVLGRGYDQNTLAERRHPTREDLDGISAGHPVLLWHTSGHALTCNTRALELAGVTAATGTPPGGDIERDEHGSPTGVLKETPAMDLVGNMVPQPTISQGTDAIIRAMEVMSREGITSASDAATGTGHDIHETLRMYAGALGSGRLSGRITLMPQIQFVAPPEAGEAYGPDEFHAGTDPDWLSIGPVKIFSDGALTTRTAALREPYSDTPGSSGLLIWEPETLLDMMRRAHDAGWQIATHAIGDRALATVLDCYEQVLAATPRKDHRHRVEHCMLLDHALAQRISRLGIVPVLQPGFIERLGDAYIAGLGMDRASQLMPMEMFDWLGIPVAFSSDRPVIPGKPLTGIRSAIERVAPSGTVLGPNHRISALQAIRCYTAGSAYATHRESRIGILRRGALADMTVLSRDPAEYPADSWDKIRISMTIVGGSESYRA